MRLPVAQLMAILNVTPDSFSDGGLWCKPQQALQHARELIEQGADILDVGGESTRPGASPVTPREEHDRVIPVIDEISQSLNVEGAVRISIDTTKAAIADAALRAGASIVNDISALRADPDMVDVIAQHQATCCLMHMQGTPQTMQQQPVYADVVDDVKAFLAAQIQFALDHGVAAESIWVDPGIGFGKTVDHNLELIQRLDEIVVLGFPVVIGISRKSFLGKLTGQPVHARLAGTIAANLAAYRLGARIFRVHDVAPLADACKVFRATV